MTFGFELLQDREIPELRTRAKLYRHVRTGAELLSFINDDENKVFGISFRTPPGDSTGVAHILEHSVLCGSRKYPVKEPFVELLKGSLKTFLNAFTYPDKTCYPVASQNVEDFHHLIDVYLDAVFYPRIPPLVFQQEGWHLDLESPDRPLTYKGVVYNEMKGAYSSPDNLLLELSQQSLFPDTTYGLDSGGNPREIPKLTYEQFKAFHDKYYHPSNARIFFHGDDDPESRLAILDAYLKDFDAREVDSTVPLQAPFTAPRKIVRPFASGGEGGGAEGARGMITVNWVLPEPFDPERLLAFQVLYHSLLGMSGSPLRKVLIDSGLGQGLAGGGLEKELRQMIFSTGLKGVRPEDADRVEALIFDTLMVIARDGIDPETVEASLNTLEFRLREGNGGSTPRGLSLMLTTLIGWLHGRDPLELVAFDAPLRRVKETLASDPGFLKGLVAEWLIGNPHRSTVVLVPDPELAAKDAAEELETMKCVRESLGEEGVRAVLEETRAIRAWQETPDTPEALATIPSLRVEDLEKKNKFIPFEIGETEGARVLTHDIFANGIAYFDLGFDLRVLPEKYLPYVPLFGKALLGMGTLKESHTDLSRRISRTTGGIRPEIFSATMAGSDRATAWLILRGKGMVAQAGDLLGLFRDILLTPRLDDKERFRQILLQEKAKHEQRLVPSGHQLISFRLRAHFSEADLANERMSGVSQHCFVRDLARDFDTAWPEVLGTLQTMREILANRGALVVNVTSDGTSLGGFEPGLRDFIREIPGGDPERAPWRLDSAYAPEGEGFIVPATVHFVGKGANLYRLGYAFHGSSQVISSYLRATWLWDQVRVQGGAYGAFCQFDRNSGNLTMVSYRDPNLARTLDCFDGTAEYLRTAPLGPGELTKAIIGAVGALDTHLLPDAKGYLSMLRYLNGDTEERRQRVRDEVLGTTAADFRAFGEVLRAFAEKGIVKVLGGEASLEDFAAKRPGGLALSKLL